MYKYEIGWHESHYMEAEAENREDAERILDELATTRLDSVDTFDGFVGDIYIWQVLPDIEVSDNIVFNYEADAFGYADLTENDGDEIE